MSLDVDLLGVDLVPTVESSPNETGSRRVRSVGMMFAGAICLAYLVIDPPSQDFASGHFRAELANRGVYLWDNLWFGGHPLPGFGIVSPVLGSVFGVVPVALISVLVATWCFALIVERWHETHPGLPDPVVGVVLFACGCGVNLWGGRLTFLPAVMFGSMAMLALATRAKVAAGGVRSPVWSVVTVGSSVARRHPGRRVVRAGRAAAAARDRGGRRGRSDRHADPRVSRRRLVPVHRWQPRAGDGSIGRCRLVWPSRAARSLGSDRLRRRRPRCVRGQVAVGRERGETGLAPRRSRRRTHLEESSSHAGAGDRRRRPDLERASTSRWRSGRRIELRLRATTTRWCRTSAQSRDRSGSRWCRRTRSRTPTRWRCGSAALPVVGKPSSIGSSIPSSTRAGSTTRRITVGCSRTRSRSSRCRSGSCVPRRRTRRR